MSDVSTTPSPDALATVAFLTGVSAPNTLQIGTQPPLVLSPGTLTVDNFWSWDSSVTTGTLYDGADWPHKWGGGDSGTGGGTVTYAFDPGSDFTAAETGIISSALALWSAVANITFLQVASTTAAQVDFDKTDSSDVSNLAAGTYTQDVAPVGTFGATLMPATTHATTVFDTSEAAWSQLSSFTAYGGYGVDTVIHELGHILGLGHAGPYNGTVNTQTQQYNATDGRQWSIMSYIDPDTPAKYSADYTYTDTEWGSVGGYAREPTTWMPLDILAAQRLYGPPASTPLSGGQVFGFNCNVAPSIRSFFDFTINTAPVVTLWDEGGGNTLDLSGFTTPSVVDLNPGAFSSADGMVNNIGIAYGTAIDAVVGGAGGLVATVNADADTIRATGGQNAAVFASPAAMYLAGDAGIGVTTVLSGAGVTDTLLGVQTLRFSGGGDTITANAGAVALSGGGNALFLGATYTAVTSAGGDTVAAGAGGAAVTVAGGTGSVIFGSAAPLAVTGGGGTDTVVSGGGGAMVTGGIGGAVVWAGGPLTFLGGLGAATVVGGVASVVVRGQQGGGLFVGGGGGGNVLAAVGGAATLIGGGGGDQLVAANAAPDVLIAGGGNETLWGAGTQGDITFWAGGGADELVGGAADNTFVAGAGTASVVAGGGANLLVLFNGLAGGTVDVTGWTPQNDRIELEGYGANTQADAVASAMVTGGGTTLTLSDDTRITFAGLQGVSPSWFAVS